MHNDWQDDPEIQAAALDGFLSNPIAVSYARARAIERPAMALQIYVSTKFYLKHREAIDAWVTDHGVEPTMTPLPSYIRIQGGAVTFEQFVPNERGTIHVDPDTGDVRRTTVTVPKVRDWPFAFKTFDDEPAP